FMDLRVGLANAEPGSAGALSDYYPSIPAVNQYEGGIYGLPWIAQPGVTYYNRALSEADCLDEPTAVWTWDDFMEYASALTLDTDGDGETEQWGFINTGWPPHVHLRLAGGR